MVNAKIKAEKKYFYGIYGIHFIWHGEWSDPELIWHGKSFNYYALEDALWSRFKEEYAEIGMEAPEEKFPEWVKKNAWLARETLQNILDARKAAKKA